MKILLDTHALWWFYSGSRELSKTALEAITENDAYISIASFWEISIKVSIGKMNLDAPLDEFFKNVLDKRIFILPLGLDHVLKSSQLPFHHRDPFDRIIIAQAIVENMSLVTIDADFKLYAEQENFKIIW